MRTRFFSIFLTVVITSSVFIDPSVLQTVSITLCEILTENLSEEEPHFDLDGDIKFRSVGSNFMQQLFGYSSIYPVSLLGSLTPYQEVSNPPPE